MSEKPTQWMAILLHEGDPWGEDWAVIRSDTGRDVPAVYAARFHTRHHPDAEAAARGEAARLSATLAPCAYCGAVADRTQGLHHEDCPEN